MTPLRRIALGLGLALATIATIIWSEVQADVLTAQFHDSLFTIAIGKTLALAIWLLPLVCRRFRDVGTLRLTWSWTVLLGVPYIASNLWYFKPISGDEPAKIALLHIWFGMATGVFEELVFRGYMFRHSPERQPHLTILVSAAMFGLIHFNQSAFQVLLAFLLGVAFGIIRLVSGSLAWCMVLHGILDVTDRFMSGPGIGDEFPMLSLFAAATLIVFWRHPRLRSGYLPQTIVSSRSQS